MKFNEIQLKNIGKGLYFVCNKADLTKEDIINTKEKFGNYTIENTDKYQTLQIDDCIISVYKDNYVFKAHDNNDFCYKVKFNISNNMLDLTNKTNLEIENFVNKLNVRKYKISWMNQKDFDDIFNLFKIEKLNMFNNYMKSNIVKIIINALSEKYDIIKINEWFIGKETSFYNVDLIDSIDLIDTKDNYSSEKQPEKVDVIISNEVEKDLKNFMSKPGSDLSKITINELISYKPNKEIKVYRGMGWEPFNLYKLNELKDYPFKLNHYHNFKFSRASSWSSNLLIAEQFAKDRSLLWIVCELIVSPKDIIVDTRLFPNEKLKLLYQAYQREIILKKGTYNCKIITIGLKDKDDLTTGWENYDKDIWVKIENKFKELYQFILISFPYAKYKTKNERIFKDYAVEQPLIMFKSRTAEAALEIKTKDSIKLILSNWHSKVQFITIFETNSSNELNTFLDNKEKILEILKQNI